MNRFGGYEDDDVTDWGQENIEQSERDLDVAVAAARTTPDEVHDALMGMIGLVMSVVARPDTTDNVARILLQDPRYRAARDVAKEYL